MVLSLKDFQIIWLKNAHKTLNALPNKEQEKIVKKISSLKDNINTLHIKKLTGFTDMYRIKSPDYRVIYKVRAQKKII